LFQNNSHVMLDTSSTFAMNSTTDKANLSHLTLEEFEYQHIVNQISQMEFQDNMLSSQPQTATGRTFCDWRVYIEVNKPLRRGRYQWYQ
jgi:hypothetical protein